MKAIQISASGGPEVLGCVELPEPVAGDGEVVVRAQALGVGEPDARAQTRRAHEMLDTRAAFGTIILKP